MGHHQVVPAVDAAAITVPDLDGLLQLFELQHGQQVLYMCVWSHVGVEEMLAFA